MEHKACPSAVAIFAKEWPTGAKVNRANALRAVELGLDIAWFAYNYLPTEELRSEYLYQLAPMRKEYLCQVKPLREEYWRQEALLRPPPITENGRGAEYYRQGTLQWEEYCRQEALLRAEYYRQFEPLLEKYERQMALVLLSLIEGNNGE